MKDLVTYIREGFDKRYPNVVVMCGIPGAGKSTWVKENYPDWPFVSRDEIRAQLGFTKDADEKAALSKEDEAKVTKEENKQIDDLCQQAWDKKIDGFVIDDTNTGRFRTSLFDHLHEMSMHIIGVNVKTDIETCIKRREGQIPENVMRKIAKNCKYIEPDEVDELINYESNK